MNTEITVEVTTEIVAIQKLLILAEQKKRNNVRVTWDADKNLFLIEDLESDGEVCRWSYSSPQQVLNYAIDSLSK